MQSNEPLTFDNETANTVKAAFTSAGNALDDQAGSRGSAVQTAMTEFSGYFSTVYDHNATVAANDSGELAERLRQVANQIEKIKESAERENENRQKAREWDERNFLEQFGDWIHNNPRPNDTETPPDFTPEAINVSPKELPPVGSVGDNGGISSAIPDNLRSANSLLNGLDAELATADSLQTQLDNFASQCQWGSLDASSIISAYRSWLSTNGEERIWLGTIADAFDAAGSSSGVVSLSNSALQSTLDSAGASTNVRTDLAIDPPTVAGAIPTSGFTNDPVNAATGNFVELETDLAFTGIAEPLSLTRMYNSQSEYAGVFGPGWASALDSSLLLSNENARWVMADGRHIIFPRSGEGWERGTDTALWLAVESSTNFSELSLDAAEVLAVRSNDGAWWVFSAQGRWLGSGHGPGTSLSVKRDAEGYVTEISQAHGRSLRVEYANGLVAYVQADDGRRVEYSYDSKGYLRQVFGALGSRTYRWNESGLLEAVVSADGVVEVVNTYDEQARVVHQLSEFGRQIRYSYMNNGVTVVDNEDGSYSNVWIHDARARLVGIVDADNQRQSMAYDKFGNRVSVTERDGSITVHGFDQRGRLIRTRTAEGADFTYRYDEHDRVVDVVTGSGGLIHYEYARAEDRNPSIVVDPTGGRTEMVWERGLLTSVTGPTGVRAHLAYSALGDLVSVQNAVGDTFRLVRDSAGLVQKVVSASGAATTFTYDAAGLPVAREDADGAIWRFSYTAGGKLKTVVDPLGATTAMEYGPHGELVKTVDPLGRVVERSFDEMGNVESLLLPNGSSFGFEYDGMMQLGAVIDPAGGKWLREYGVNGNVTALVDPTGVRTSIEEDRGTGVSTVRDAFSAWSFTQDQYGRLVKESDPASGELGQVYTYDAAGRVVESLDAEGGLTLIERDAAGNVVAVVSPGGKRFSYSYDRCGRPKVSTAPDGSSIRLEYDADSRVTARVLANGSRELFVYDVMGRVVEHRSATGALTRCRYDKLGRLVALSDPQFGRRRFAYDAAGQLVSVTNGLGGKTSYTYDAAGQVISQLSPSGALTRYEYDALGRVIRTVDPLGRSNACGYDAAGRQTWVHDAAGNETAYSYDSGVLERLTVNGVLVARIEHDTATHTTQIFDHTAPGNEPAPAGAPTQVHSLTCDRLGRLVKHSYGKHVLTWAYDADGARTRFTMDGAHTDYEYTATGLLASASCAGSTVHYAYSSTGALTRITSDNGSLNDIFESFPLKKANPHTNLKEPTGFAVIRTHQGSQEKSTTYYDANARITAIEDTTGLRLFTYDAAGQITALQTNHGTYRYTYNTSGHLLHESTPDGQERTYTYDAAGQLLSVTSTNGTHLQYVYDGLGRRIRATSSQGITREYTWNNQGTLSNIQETQQGHSNNLPLWTNALGFLETAGNQELTWDTANLIPTLASLDSQPTSTLPGACNHQGSWLPNSISQGAFTSSSVDPWGEPATQWGSDTLGQIALDASGSVSFAGLSWMGARVYDPSTRSFLSTDPLPSPVGAGWGANPYAFLGNDPVNLMDPWGLSPVGVQEMRDYQAAHPTGIGIVQKWANENADTIAKVAMVAGAALTIAAIAATGPVGMIALGAVGGAALSGGFSILNNKNPDGTVNWGTVGVDTLVGGAIGAIGGAGSAATKLTMAVTKSPSRFAGSVAVNAGINFTTGAIGGGATYGFQTAAKGESWNWRKFAGNTIGGGMAATIGGFFGPGSGTLAKAVPQLKQRATEFGMNFLGGVAAEGTNSLISGEKASLMNIGLAGITSAGLSQVQVTKPSNIATLNQASYYTPSTFKGMFRGVQAGRMWQGGLQGSILSIVSDLSIKGFLNID